MYNISKRFSTALIVASLSSVATASCNASFDHPWPAPPQPWWKITPKVFIISMFSPEAEVWHGIPEFDLLAKNITIPGLSPIFPDVHCTANDEVCQLTTGESEINAASTVTAVAQSDLFDLSKTYFLIAGIAGVNPKVATIGSVTFAKYAVQVALQYEIDARELPPGFTTGYFPQGASTPDEYPEDIYGTEVFEVNDALRQIAIGFAKNATLNDTAEAQAYRDLYAENPAYAAAGSPSDVVACDVATSDVYFTGSLLGEAFENTTKLFTNGSGVYCTTAQEDNASLEALLRAAQTERVDFSRIIVMRTASDFDRPHDNQTILDNLLVQGQGFEPSILNIYLAGVKVVEGILNGWWSTFEKGVAPTNYIGDIFGTLGGEPDFGPGSEFTDGPDTFIEQQVKKRSLKKRGMRRW